MMIIPRAQTSKLQGYDLLNRFSVYLSFMAGSHFLIFSKYRSISGGKYSGVAADTFIFSSNVKDEPKSTTLTYSSFVWSLSSFTRILSGFISAWTRLFD